jgi:hypothetical protein
MRNSRGWLARGPTGDGPEINTHAVYFTCLDSRLQPARLTNHRRPGPNLTVIRMTGGAAALLNPRDRLSAVSQLLDLHIRNRPFEAVEVQLHRGSSSLNMLCGPGREFSDIDPSLPGSLYLLGEQAASVVRAKFLELGVAMVVFATVVDLDDRGRTRLVPRPTYL